MVLSQQQRDWMQLLAALTRDQPTAATQGGTTGGKSGVASQDCSLGWAGLALVGVADGNWSEAKEAIDKSR